MINLNLLVKALEEGTEMENLHEREVLGPGSPFVPICRLAQLDQFEIAWIHDPLQSARRFSFFQAI